MRAAATVGSRRIGIGVAPAWQAWPLQPDHPPLDAEDAVQRGEAQAGRLEQRALLDVQLGRRDDRAHARRRR